MSVNILPTHPSTETIEVKNPITGEVVGNVSHSTPEEVIQAVGRAREAQKSWKELSYRQKAKIFVRAHDRIIQEREALFDVIQSESGKSRRDAFVELFATLSDMRYYIYHGEKAIRPRRVRAGIPPRDFSKVIYHPVGVVGIISPWNFPFILSLCDAVPALLAGNGVVLKPASNTPLSAIWGRQKFVEAGLTEDLFQIVTGPGRELGNALVDNVDYLMFTGSTAIGRQLAQRAAGRLIGYSMELGGKNAVLVLPDADLKHAATIVIEGAFNNCGQVCIHFERLIVHAEVYQAFKNELIRQLSQVRMGSGNNFNFDLGSLISSSQLDEVEAHVRDALDKGAQVIYGGKRLPNLGPAYYQPTILEGVTPEMEVYAEETFGPVLSMYKVDSIEEAIQLANDSRYGLHYAVCTGNLHLGEQVARQLQAGSVCVNDSYMNWAVVDGPMGGFKESGVGRRHGPEGIRKYSEPQTIVINRTHFQIGSFETPLSLNARLANLLAKLLALWRKVPLIR